MDMTKARTSYPGKIVTFDAATQSAVVQVARERYVDNLDGLNILEESPLLIQVPVHFPQGGGYSLTFPVTKGDNCLVMFAERGCSHWVQRGAMKIGVFATGVPKPDFHRMFDVNDSFALVGFNPVPQAIPNFQAASVELRSADRSQRITFIPGGLVEVRTPTIVDVVASTVNIKGNVNIDGNVTVTGTITANGVIKSLVDVVAQVISLFSHTHTSNVPGLPTSPPLP